MKYNLHVIKCTAVKPTVRWGLTNVQSVQLRYKSVYKTILSPQKSLCFSLSGSPVLHHCHYDFYEHSLVLFILWFCKIKQHKSLYIWFLSFKHFRSPQMLLNVLADIPAYCSVNSPWNRQFTDLYSTISGNLDCSQFGDTI